VNTKLPIKPDKESGSHPRTLVGEDENYLILKQCWRRECQILLCLRFPPKN
jgi:hypothetical protein